MDNDFRNDIGVSLILATLGRTSEIARFADSLLGNTKAQFEVVVVDQNDDDRLDLVIVTMKKMGIDVKHLRMREKSLSKARNLGIENAKYPIIGFPDDDCWYGPKLLDSLVGYFQGCANMSGAMAHWVERIGDVPARKIISFDRLIRFREIPVASITLFFNRGLIEKVGDFDHRFGVNQYYGSSEETDFVLRALKIGAVISFLPDIQVHHHWGGIVNSGFDLLAIKKEFISSRGRARGTGGIYAKHGAPIYVVLRGVFSPLVRCALSLHKPSDAAFQFGASVGRLEGYLSWKLKF